MATVLIPCDSSEHSKPAVKWAIENFPNGVFELLMVVPPLPTCPPLAGLASILSEQDLTAEKELEQLKPMFHGIEHKLSTCSVVRGDPRSVIINQARHNDVLVVGTRNLGSMSLLLGSVSDYCAHYASAVVVICKSQEEGKPNTQRWEEPRTLVLALDGSAAGLATLGFAKTFVRTGDQLHLIHAYEPLQAYSPMDVFPAIDVANFIREDTDECNKKYIDAVLKNLQSFAQVLDPLTNTKCIIVIKEGDARDALCKYVEETQVDALLVGSRGRGEVTSVLLGSVSRHCAHFAKTTVIVTKPNAVYNTL